jgi:NAD(P)H-hydrate epimerase
MSGSIALSAIAALRTGAGLVTAAVPDRCLETVAAFHPAVMTWALPDDARGRFSLAAAAAVGTNLSAASAIGCGPGMTTQPGSMRIVERLLGSSGIPRLLDADGINSLALLGWSGAQDPGPLVLTPHPGELERLTGVPAGQAEAQRDAARLLARRSGVVIVVKGGPSVVVGPDRSWTNTTGNPGMATAGSGDVLSGVITALLAQGLPPWDAACLGVWMHGCAGDLAADRYGQPGMTAVEILEMLPAAVLRAVDS